MAMYDGTIYIDTKIKTSGIDKDVAEIESKLKNLHNSGRDAKQAGTNPEYAALSQQLSAAEKEAARLDARFNAIVDKEERFIAIGGDTNSKTFQGYEFDLEKTGAAFKEAQARVEELREKMASMPSGVADGIQQEGQAANAAATPVEKLSNATKKLEKETGKAAKSTKLLNGHFKLTKLSAGKLFRTVLKYVFGIRSVYMLVRKIRQAIKEGFQTFAQVDAQTNKSISTLKSSLTQLKNSFAVAFAPVLNSVAPILSRLIQMLVTATNYVAMFFAALSGASTYKAAKYAYEDYAEGLDKVGGAAQRNLSGLDELNIWNNGGGGGGGVDASDMFETLPIEFAEGTFFDRFLEALKNGDWKEAGVIMGEKFNDVVGGIDWKGIGAKVGKKLTDVIRLAYGFLTTADLRQLGRGLVDVVNGFLVNTDWETTARTIAAAVNDVLDFVGGWIENADFGALGNAIGNFVYGLVDEAAEWFGRFDFEKLSYSIFKGIIDFLNSIDGTKIGNSLSKLVQNVLSALSQIVEHIEIGAVTHAITNLAKDIIAGIDFRAVLVAALKFIRSLVRGILNDLPVVIAELSVMNVTANLLSGIFRALGLDTAAAFIDTFADTITTRWPGVIRGAFEGTSSGFVNDVWDWLTGEDSSEGHNSDSGRFGYSEPEEQTPQPQYVSQNSEQWEGRLSNISTEISSDVYVASALIEDIYALNTETAKTPAQISEIVEKCEMLNGLGLDGITIEYDELTGEIITQKDELTKLIDNYIKQLELEALSEAFKEAYRVKAEATRKLTELNNSLTEAERAYTDAINERDEYERKYAGTSEYSIEKYNELNDAVKDARASVKEYSAEIAETRGVLADASDAVDYYMGEITARSAEGGEEIGSAISNGIEDGITNSEDGIAAKTESAVDEAVSAGKAAAKEAMTIGEFFSEGLIEGIINKTDEIRGAASRAMRAGLSGFTVTAKISSPSKVTEGYGEFLDEGAANGVDKNAGLIESAMENSANKALYAMESTFAGAQIPFPALASGSIIPTMASLSAASNQSAFGSAGLENTLKSLLADFMRSKTYQVSAKANARTIFELVIDEGKRQFASTGRNAFELSALG